MTNKQLLGKYSVCFSIKSIIIWEGILQKPFGIVTLTDLYVYIYSCMLASGEYEGDYDAFIELMDGTAGIVEEFNKVMKEHYDNEKAVYGLQDSEGRTEDVKKKG